jgi:hypothetical protein
MGQLLDAIFESESMQTYIEENEDIVLGINEIFSNFPAEVEKHVNENLSDFIGTTVHETHENIKEFTAVACSTFLNEICSLIAAEM